VSALEIVINDLPKTANSIGKNSFWYTQAERKKWRHAVLVAVVREVQQREKVGMPYPRASLTLTRHSSSEPDIDNLYSSFKFVIDGLVHAGVIIDDKPSVIDLKCCWQRAKRSEGKITIRVEAAA
jgi:Holliday junction resolvase RusA-like endonuclease